MHWIDADHLPVTRGKVATVLYNPRGEIDGAFLADGTEVHIPPHLARAIGRDLRPGAALTVRGLRPRGADMVVAVRAQAGRGRPLDDEGPHHRGAPRPAPSTRAMHVSGTVLQTLHSPRGEVAGGLLDSGDIVRMAPHGNEALAGYFEPGARIEAWGDGFRRSGVRVVEIGDVAFAEDDE